MYFQDLLLLMNIEQTTKKESVWQTVFAYAEVKLL